LLIYCKIDTEKKIAEFKKKPELSKEMTEETMPKAKFKLADLE
jgi:hypothetical protein